MIPQNDGLRQDFTIAQRQPSATYKADFNRRKISGSIDEIEAVKQAIHLILNIERYQHLIYSWNYGIELSDLIGQPKEYAKSEIKRRIKEALMQDDRVLGVDAFVFEESRNSMHVTFSVDTIFGEVKADKEVEI